MSGPGFAVVGADHLHLFSLVDALVEAGAVAVAHVPSGALIDLYTGWQATSRSASFEEILDDDHIQIIVTVGPHHRRAEVAAAVLERGRHVLSAKPGVVDRPGLDRIRAAVAGRTGRPWTVLFSERFENRAISRAVAMARANELGQVVAVQASAPHLLVADGRADWFWSASSSGGILVDLGAHQVDQFLAICGDPDVSGDANLGVRVLESRVGNVAYPEHPEMQDIGLMTLASDKAIGQHRVDYLSPGGLPTWGDVRLSIVGTLATVEVRSNIDLDGAAGPEHLFLVDGQGVKRIDVSGDERSWAREFLADVADDGQRLMTQDHVLAVTELTLLAQENAKQWGAQ